MWKQVEEEDRLQVTVYYGAERCDFRARKKRQ